MKPRDYQQRAIDSIRTEWRNGRSTLLVMATGGGKTFTAITALEQDNAKRTLWLVHRDYLADQAVDGLRKGWPEIYPHAGIVQGQRNDGNGRFVAATVQTLRNDARLRAVLRSGYFSHLVVDETHRGEFYPDRKRNDPVSKIKRYCPNIKILGLTATPVKANGENAAWLYDSVAAEISIQNLVDDGYLVEPIGRKFLLNGTMANLLPSKKTGDYTDAQLGRILDTGNNAEIIFSKWTQFAANRQTIGFTATIKQAEHLAAYFRHQGVRAFSISGETNKTQRAKIIAAYKRGIIQVVFNAAVLIEGFDAPKTSCIIMARPTQSQALFTQCVGRGLRLAENKENCEVLNFAPRNGQSLITTEAIYDPEKKKEFAASKRAAPIAQQVGANAERQQENAVLRSVEVKIGDVSELDLDLWIRYQIITGRMVGQTTLKKEAYQHLEPTQVEPERPQQTLLGKIASFFK